jgi:hypothetical protein
LDEPGILPHCQSAPIATTCEQELPRFACRQGRYSSIAWRVWRIATRGDVIDADGDDIAAAQLAIDGEIEEG